MAGENNGSVPSEPAPKQSDYDFGDTGFDPEIEPQMFVESSVPVAGQAGSAAAPPPSAAAAGAPAEYKHPARLVRDAEAVGLTEDEILSTPPEYLQRTVYAAMRAMALAGGGRAGGEGVAQKQPAQAPVAAPVPEPEVDPLDDPEFDDPAVYDPKIVKAMRSLKKGQAEEVKALKEKLAKMEQLEQQRVQAQQQSRDQYIDNLFIKLGPKYAAVFGVKPAAKMHPSDPQFIARQKVLEIGDKLEGEPEECLRRAAEFLYGDKAAQVEDEEEETPVPAPVPVGKKKPSVAQPAASPAGVPAPVPGKALADRQAAWNGAATARPTQHARSLPKGDRAAVVTAARWMRENFGDEEDKPSDEELNGFL